MVFIFSDFVLTQPGEQTEQSLENYRIIERMVDTGVRVCGCVSPLARKSIFKPYTADALKRLEEIGVYMADTYKPSKFLEMAHEFVEDPY